MEKTITLDEFDALPVLPDGPGFMVPGTKKRYLDNELAQQQEFTKERKARFYMLHFYEAEMNSAGQLSVTLTSATALDPTKPEIEMPDISSYLGKPKSERVKEIEKMKISSAKLGFFSRVWLAIKIIFGKA